jgi:hypothetical protein
MSYQLGTEIASKELEAVSEHIDDDLFTYKNKTDQLRKEIAQACIGYLETDNKNHQEAYMLLIGEYKKELADITNRSKSSLIDKEGFKEDVKAKIKNEALAVKYGKTVRTIQRWKKTHIS